MLKPISLLLNIKEEKMKLWIDDVRPIPTNMFVDFDLHLHSIDETIECLKNHLSEVDFISLAMVII